MNTFNANGKKNGGTLADPTNGDFISSVQDNGVQAAGIVTIPVCSAEEATKNWNTVSGGGKKSAHYPCN